MAAGNAGARGVADIVVADAEQGRAADLPLGIEGDPVGGPARLAAGVGLDPVDLVVASAIPGDQLQTAVACDHLVIVGCPAGADMGPLDPPAAGVAVEGPVFRKMTPADADEALLKLAVMARSSPDDKHLLVTRLNGGAIPKNQMEWEKFHEKYPELKWETHKDQILPGYKEEWKKTRPCGGEVVGVTGDGTNELLERIDQHLGRSAVLARIHISPTDGAARAWLHQNAIVKSSHFDDQGHEQILVSIDPADHARLCSRWPALCVLRGEA